MEGTARHPVGPAPLEGHEVAHHVNYLRGVEDGLDCLLRYHTVCLAGMLFLWEQNVWNFKGTDYFWIFFHPGGGVSFVPGGRAFP